MQEEEPNEEETYQVITSLKKVSIFSASHNLGHWNIWDSIFQDIYDAKEKVRKTLPEEVTEVSCFLIYPPSSVSSNNLMTIYNCRPLNIVLVLVIMVFCGI